MLNINRKNCAPLRHLWPIIASTLVTFPAIAENKETMASWIIRQTEIDSIPPNSPAPGLSYAISGEELHRRVEFPTLAGGGTVQMSIPIQQISRIEYLYTERYLAYSLSCTNNCVKTTRQGGAAAPITSEPRKLLFEIKRKLDPDFPPRMHQALLKLIELHGGKARLMPLYLPRTVF